VQRDLLGGRTSPSWTHFDIPDGQVCLLHSFLPERDAWKLFDTLRDSVDWRQDEILTFGRRVRIPRLHRWMSEPGHTYAWSGIVMDSIHWSPEVVEVRNRLNTLLGANFNGVLLNLYRDGEDCVGWHSDNEAIFGAQPTIASVSLGEERDFLLRHKTRRDLDVLRISLEHGSVLLMSGVTQTHWLHSLPRRSRVKSMRINLTFRQLIA